MTTLLLINPNSSTATLEMMLAAARPALPDGFSLRGVAAERGVSMIVDEDQLRDAAAEVVRLGMLHAPDVAGIIVAAFGDPGREMLKDRLAIPVVGIGEASLLEAAGRGRRFGIATTTPALGDAITSMVGRAGLAGQFTGIRFAATSPQVLAAAPSAQAEELAAAASACLSADGADAVVIGGGPLSSAAQQLRARYGDRIVEPVPAAVRLLVRRLGPASGGSPVTLGTP